MLSTARGFTSRVDAGRFILAELRRLPLQEARVERMHFLRRISLPIVLVLACASAGLARMQSVPSPARPPSPPAYSPMLAAHDVDVGKFYMKRGDVDGAIARYKDALRYKPNYAEPCLLLGQAYEQKHDPASAIDYYQQYLKILPTASESKRVRKRIADLQDKMKKDGAVSSQPNR